MSQFQKSELIHEKAITVEIKIDNPHKKQYIDVEQTTIYWSIFHGGIECIKYRLYGA
jgi:hypothetical protein